MKEEQVICNINYQCSRYV